MVGHDVGSAPRQYVVQGRILENDVDGQTRCFNTAVPHTSPSKHIHFNIYSLQRTVLFALLGWAPPISADPARIARAPRPASHPCHSNRKRTMVLSLTGHKAALGTPLRTVSHRLCTTRLAPWLLPQHGQPAARIATPTRQPCTNWPRMLHRQACTIVSATQADDLAATDNTFVVTTPLYYVNAGVCADAYSTSHYCMCVLLLATPWTAH